MSDITYCPINSNMNETEIALRNNEMEQYFWDVLTLSAVGRKYHLTRERVRQIFEMNGFDAMSIKKAVRDYKEYNLIDRKYVVCDCGKAYRVGLQKFRKFLETVYDTCPHCYAKRLAKLNGYAHQRKWMSKHSEYVKTLQREYYQKHKKQFRRYARKYYHLHKNI